MSNAKRGNAEEKPPNRFLARRSRGTIPLLPVDRSRPIPTSYNQERLWFLDKLDPAAGAAYHIEGVFQLCGPLDVAALETAVAAVVDRHESLRTTFADDPNTGLHQVIAQPGAPACVDLEDVSALSEDALAALVATRLAERFDLAKGPLLRVRLLKRALNKHILIVSGHHAVLDGWSVGILMKEISAFYSEVTTGAKRSLPELTLQYADYAAWQRQVIPDEALAAEMTWWRDRLAGMPDAIALPTDRPRTHAMDYSGGSVPVRIPQGLSTQLKRLAVGEGATLFMALSAAFSALLSRLGAGTDVVIGTAVAGRPRPELDGLVGHFVNTLALRHKIEPERSFRDHLTATKATVLEALAHANLPFERVVEAVAPSRTLRHMPVVQVTLVLQNVSDDTAALDLPGVKTSPFGTGRTTAQFELALELAETAQGLTGLLSFATQLFDRTTATRLAAMFERLLAAVVAAPNTSLAELALIDASERRQLITTFNDTATGAPSDNTIVDQFARNVAVQPDTIAVIEGAVAITYRALDAASNRMAHHLVALGVTPETVVGVCLHRSTDHLLALLAIWKAGAAYLPLDPINPEARLTFMLDDSGAGVIITSQMLLEQFPGLGLGERRTTLLVDDLAPARDVSAQTAYPQHAAPQLTKFSPDNIAVAIYTSGSTGTPKCSSFTYRSALNCAIEAARLRKVFPGERMLSCSALGFDGSLFEWLPTLYAGATLVLAPAGRADPLVLQHLVRTEAITSMNVTPALLTQLDDETLDVPIICVGGERCDDSLVARFAHRCELVHTYGPTEATIFVTAGVLSTGAEITMGAPIGNTTIYVLDNRLEPVPIGVPGELFIGGVQVGRGYIGRSDQTAENFLADPFADVPGARLYRTGDLVRWRTNGTLEFLGRDDDQVKIRGMRVELGEIEAALSRCDGLTQAAVVARERMGDTRLVAYLVPAGKNTAANEAGAEVLSEDTVDLDQIRTDLKRFLPEHMLPSGYVVLSRLPISVAGKVDRNALPDVEIAVSKAPYEAPKTETELIVAAAISDVLEVENVGRHDNFFDLGGHSLMAIRLVARLERDVGRSLPLRTVFDGPTVGELAEALGNTEDNLSHAPLVPSTRTALEPFPLTDVQAAYYIGRQGGGALGDVACFAFWAVAFPRLDVKRLEAAMDDVVAAHPMLRTVFAPDLTQRVLADVPAIQIPIVDLSAETTEVAQARWLALVKDLSHRVLPADRWPLFDIRAVRFAGDLWRLTLGFDLLIGDAVSANIIVDQLFGRYFETIGRLSTPSLSFRDVVLHRTEERKGARYARAAEYWRARIETLPAAPQLPFAKAPGEMMEARFERREHRISVGDWTRFKAHCAELGFTPTSALLAVYSAILATWSASDDHLIHLTVMDRKPLHPQIADIVGDFTTISLFAALDPRQGTFAERARKVQRQLVDDLDHLDFSGVEVLRELTAAGRSPGNAHVVFTSTIGAQRSDGALQLAAKHGVKTLFSVGQTPQVLLDCQVGETTEGLIVTWDAPGSLYPVGLLDDMFGTFTNIVEVLAHRASAWTETGALPLPAWQEDIVRSTNAAAAPLPCGRLQDEFFAAAAQAPGRPALIGLGPEGSDSLTFGKLRDRSLVLAAQVKSALVERSAQVIANGEIPLVAILMDKGWEQVAAAIAILEAGAALLPINVDQPDARIGSILADAQVPLVLTTKAQLSGTHSALTAAPGARAKATPEIICVDAAGLSRAHVPSRHPDAERFARQISPTDVAYVIYTSGSTGQPKGVVINHRAAMNTLADLKARFSIGPQDRVLWVSELSFDLSIFDLFAVLGAGGALVLPAAGSRQDPALWVDRAFRYGVTIWNSVPQLADMALTAAGAGAAESFATLRLVMLSGDWIPVALPDRIRSAIADCAVVSLGGATEASIWSVYYPIGAVEPGWKSIPYGKALSNQSIHVLKPDFSPCPVYVPGRLYIGGQGLANGYLGDPSKTAERFVEPLTGERRYDTGDLGRLLPGGDIELLGRADFQVKIRGHRVELGEIEATLNAHPQVEAAVAVAVGERDDKRIVAHVVPRLQADAWDPDDTTITRGFAERAAFTLANHGRPRPSDGPPIQLPGAAFEPERRARFLARQSYRSFDGTPLTRGQLEHWLRGVSSLPNSTELAHKANERDNANRPLSLSRLGAWLGTLQAMDVPNSLLSKRMYASAGGLYPVRAMLVVAEGALEGVGPGTYAYDPIDHTLLLQHPFYPSLRFEPLRIVLVGHLPAIAPLYGAWSEDACFLEAGGMARALALAAHDHGLGLRLLANPDTARKEPGVCQTGEDVVLTSFALFRDDKIPPAAVAGEFYVSIKSNAVGDLEAGVYRFSAKDGLLAHPGLGLSTTAFRGSNNAIFEAASAVIVLVPDAANLNDATEARSASLLQLGALAHQLAETAAPQEIGTCAVGGVPVSTVSGALEIDDRIAASSYLLLVGPVSPAQTKRWEPPQLKTNARDDPFGGLSWIANHLPAYMVPQAISILDHLPLSATGKVDRNRLPDLSTAPSRPAFEAPQDETEKLLAAAISRVLGVEEVSRRDSFFDLGGNSLSAVRLIHSLNTESGMQVSIRLLFENPRVAELAHALRASIGDYQPLISLDNRFAMRPGDVRRNRCRIVCFHAASGHVAPFAQPGVLDRLCPLGPVYAVQARGTGPGERVFETYDEMMTCYSEALMTLPDDLPLFLIGWSMGGSLAHDAACRLSKRGRRVDGIAVLDSLSVQADRSRPSPAPVRNSISERLLWAVDELLPEAATRMRAAQSDQERMHIFGDAAAAAGYVNVEALESDPHHIERLLTVWNHNGSLQPSRALDFFEGPALVIRAADTARDTRDPALGWSAYCSAVSTQDVKHHHNRLFDPQALSSVIDPVAAWIDLCLGER